jgi:hypothetical protein
LVSVVSGCGLDDRAIEVRSPAEAKDFSSSLCVQTGSEAHPAFCTMGTGGPFPGVKRGRGVTLTTHSHLVLRSRMSRSCTSSPPSVFMACIETASCTWIVVTTSNVDCANFGVDQLDLRGWRSFREQEECMKNERVKLKKPTGCTNTETFRFKQVTL